MFISCFDYHALLLAARFHGILNVKPQLIFTWPNFCQNLNKTILHYIQWNFTCWLRQQFVWNHYNIGLASMSHMLCKIPQTIQVTFLYNTQDLYYMTIKHPKFMLCCRNEPLFLCFSCKSKTTFLLCHTVFFKTCSPYLQKRENVTQLINSGVT